MVADSRTSSPPITAPGLRAVRPAHIGMASAHKRMARTYDARLKVVGKSGDDGTLISSQQMTKPRPFYKSSELCGRLLISPPPRYPNRPRPLPIAGDRGATIRKR
jgi:hypothetical protein